MEVQLLGKTGGLHVELPQEDPVTLLELRCRKTMRIGILFVNVLGFCHGRSALFVNGLQVCHPSLGLGRAGAVDHSLEARMVAKSGEKWLFLGDNRLRIVVGKSQIRLPRSLKERGGECSAAV